MFTFAAMASLLNSILHGLSQAICQHQLNYFTAAACTHLTTTAHYLPTVFIILYAQFIRYPAPALAAFISNIILQFRQIHVC